MMAKPEDREAAVSKLFEKAGGKLLAYYVTFGEYDWLLIGEFPNEKKLASAISRGGSGRQRHEHPNDGGHDLLASHGRF